MWLSFKEQGVPNSVIREKQFILIIMTDFQKELLVKFGNESKIYVDRTHDINSYDFQLYTVFVIDDFGNGFPSTFCFSRHSFFIKYFFSMCMRQLEVKSMLRCSCRMMKLLTWTRGVKSWENLPTDYYACCM